MYSILISHILFLKKKNIKLRILENLLQLTFSNKRRCVESLVGLKLSPLLAVSSIFIISSKIKELINSYKTPRFHVHKILKTSQLTIIFIIEFVYIRIS